jgi:hypothetical protein
MQVETLDTLHMTCLELTNLAGHIREETNEVVSTNDHVKVIKHYDQLRLANALIKESREALGKIEERLSREQIPDVMRAANIRSTTIEGVGRVSLGRRWSASMTDKQEGFNWLRSTGNGGVIQETVNAQTLGALAKELNENGVELPAPIFTTSIMTYTSITKV